MSRLEASATKGDGKMPRWRPRRYI